MDYLPYNAQTEGPWKDFFMVLGIVLLFPVFWPIYQLRRQYRLRSRGFWVSRKERDLLEYQERRSGKILRLTVYAEMTVVGPRLVSFPSEEEWDKEMPEWARDRRLEIFENVKRSLGTKHYEYDLP